MPTNDLSPLIFPTTEIRQLGKSKESGHIPQDVPYLRYDVFHAASFRGKIGMVPNIVVGYEKGVIASAAERCILVCS